MDHGGPLEAIILLTRNGASVDAWDARNEATPLLMAIFRGQREALHLLLALRAETNIVGAEGDSPLRWHRIVGVYSERAAGQTRATAPGERPC